MTKKEAYKSNSFQLLNGSLFFIVGNNSPLSATIVLSRSPMAYNTTASQDLLTCTNFVDFAKCEARFGHFSWSELDSNELEVKLEVLKGDENRDFHLLQNLTMGSAYFKQFM